MNPSDINANSACTGMFGHLAYAQTHIGSSSDLFFYDMIG